MKGAAIAGALLVNLTAAVAACVAAPAAPGFSAGLYAVRCGTDDDLPAADRAAANATALKLVKDLLEGDGTAVLPQMTPEAQAATDPAGLATVELFIKVGRPFQNIQVAHTYVIYVSRFGGGPIPPIHCGKGLNDPEAVLLSIAPVPKQFDVEVTAHSLNNDWTTFVTLVPDRGAWKALAFRTTISAISGQSARDVRDLARKQAAKGHRLNAMLLYRASVGLADRGPNAAPIWKQDLTKEAAAFVRPEEFRGGPQYLWRVDDPAFEGADANIIGIGGHLDSDDRQAPEDLDERSTADHESRDLTTAILRAHPELPDVFAAVILRAYKPDNSGGFATVYEFGKGFDEMAPHR